MKTLILIFAMMLFSINLYSAPPEGCLWAPENPIGGAKFTDEKTNNSTPTIKIDTCGLYDINPNYYYFFPNSPDTVGKYYTGFPNITFEKSFFALKRFYTKSIWGIKMPSAVFDTTGKDLSTLNYFTIDDIDENNNQEIFEAFQQVKQSFGNIKFWFHLDKNKSINDAWKISDSGYSFIECETFVNTAEFEEFINTIVPNVECKFLSVFAHPTSVNGNPKSVFTLVLSTDYNSIYVKSDYVIQQVTVYSLTGNKLVTISDENSNTELQINISHLQTGVYFIKVNNSIHKFMVVR